MGTIAPGDDSPTPVTSAAATRQSRPIDVSIVIVAPGPSGWLDESLTAIARLDGPSWEVIVVLDEAPEANHPHAHARYVASGNVGPADKRDLGAARARGEILAFIDADAYPARQWLTAAVARLRAPEVWAVGGPGVTPPGGAFAEQVSGWTYAAHIVSGPARHRYVVEAARDVDDYPSMNLIVRKSVFDAIGGFDSTFYPGEDTKLCLEIVRRGGRIAYEPGAVAYHHRRPIWRGHLGQIAAYGRHRGHFARRFPETSRRIPYFVPSAWVLWLIGASVASVWLEPVRWLLLGSLAVYAAAVVASAGQSCRASGSARIGLAVGAAIVATHVVYGVQFLSGLFRRRP